MTLCAVKPGKVKTSIGFSILVENGLASLRRADTIVVPGIDDLDTPIPATVTRALADAHERGARVVSICTGAFVLAAAGLLDGKRATTHWMDAPALAARFPSVSVDPGVLYIDEGTVLTSAGIAAGIDLCLHLVRKDFGSEVANAVARRLVVAPHPEWRTGPVRRSAGGGATRPAAGGDAKLGPGSSGRTVDRRADGKVFREESPNLRAPFL